MGQAEFIAPVVAHVQRVTDLCTWDENGTPLLADDLDLKTGEPLRWEGQMLSNLACQQNFLRTLDALGTLTGDGTSHFVTRQKLIHKAAPVFQSQDCSCPPKSFGKKRQGTVGFDVVGGRMKLNEFQVTNLSSGRCGKDDTIPTHFSTGGCCFVQSGKAT